MVAVDVAEHLSPNTKVASFDLQLHCHSTTTWKCFLRCHIELYTWCQDDSKSAPDQDSDYSASSLKDGTLECDTADPVDSPAHPASDRLISDAVAHYNCAMDA